LDERPPILVFLEDENGFPNLDAKFVIKGRRIRDDDGHETRQSGLIVIGVPLHFSQAGRLVTGEGG
jgi:hypothetical protein